MINNKIKLSILTLALVLTSACSNNKEKTSILTVKYTVSISEALKTFNDKYPQVVVTSIDFEKEKEDYIYNIEGVNDDNEYEIYVSASDKSIIEKRVEKLDVDERNGIKRKSDALNLTNYIEPNKAMEIALSKTDNSGVIEEYSIDQELNVTYYDINVIVGKKQYEVKINSQTSEVINVKED